MQTIEQVMGNIVKMFAMPEKLRDFVTLTMRPAADIPCRHWSMMNQLLVLFSGTIDARGFRQWQKAKRKVLKGAHALGILAPHEVNIPEKTDETGKITQEARNFLRFHRVPVFRVEDTDGEPIDYKDEPPEKLPPLYEVSQRMGLKVGWSGATGGARGWYKGDSNRIQLYTNDTRTYLHELGHAIDDKVLGSLQYSTKPDRGLSECVAELAGLALGAMYAPKEIAPKYSYEYVSSWSAGKPGRALVKAVSRVEKIVAYVRAMVPEVAQ